MKSALRHLKAVEEKMRLCRRKKNLVRHQFESLPITVHAIFAVKCKKFFFFLDLFISFFTNCISFLQIGFFFVLLSLECASLSHGVLGIVLRSKKDKEKLIFMGGGRRRSRWGEEEVVWHPVHIICDAHDARYISHNWVQHMHTWSISAWTKHLLRYLRL